MKSVKEEQKKQFFPKLNFIEQFAGVAWPGVAVTIHRTESRKLRQTRPHIATLCHTTSVCSEQFQNQFPTLTQQILTRKIFYPSGKNK